MPKTELNRISRTTGRRSSALLPQPYYMLVNTVFCPALRVVSPDVRRLDYVNVMTRASGRDANRPEAGTSQR